MTTPNEDALVCDPWSACPVHGDQHWREALQRARQDAAERVASYIRRTGDTSPWSEPDTFTGPDAPDRAAPTVTAEQVESAAQAAYLSDDIGGHVRGPHLWEGIPEVGREDYRRLVRDILAALGIEVAP